MKRKKFKKARRITPDQERELIEESGRLVEDKPLTNKDKSVIENLIIKGNAYFAELGWDQTKESNYLARPTVRREIERVQAIMEDGQSLIERQKFLARVKLGAMLPAAMAIVAKTLRGMDEDGNGKRPSPEDIPTRSQYEAAQHIMDRCGVGADELNLNLLVAAPIDRRVGNAKEDKARYDPIAVVQRDRVRVSIDKLIKVYSAADTKLSDLKEARLFTKKRKKMRKKMRDKRDREEES